MDFNNIRDVAIYGTNCVVDISRGNDEVCSFVTAKEKYFDVKNDNGQLVVSQRSANIISMLIVRRLEFKLILPKSFKGRLRFRNQNGDIYIKGGSFADVELSTKNGKFDIENITCAEFMMKMRNGSVIVKNVSAADGASLKCSNANIKAESVYARSLNISCNIGGLNLADIKVAKLDCSTTNGVIDGNALSAADMRLDTTNGKITAVAAGKRTDYRLSLETTHGMIVVDGVPHKMVNDAAQCEKRITARTSNGDIDIRFCN